MITVDQARAKFIASVNCRQPVEAVPLAHALLRVAAQNVDSAIAVPPCDNSAMDGFAVNSADLQAGQTELEISQRIPAGKVPQALTPGTAARIFTGAALPDGADAVVIQENCIFSNDSNVLRILKGVSAGENVRPCGQDIHPGARIVNKGSRLTAIDLGLLASVGLADVAVYQRVRVAVFSTGDELVEPGEMLKPGQIYNSNRTMLLAVCEQMGFESVDCGIVEDTLEATQAALQEAARVADVILTSGGVSVGDEDYIKPAITALGELNHWKVQMKPGKPVVLGRIDQTPVLGLPGNPVSSYIVFQLLGVPLLQTLQGQNYLEPVSYPVTAAFNKAEVTREEYIRVQLAIAGDAGLQAQLFDNQSSGVTSSLSWAHGLVRQRIGHEINKGQPVEFLPFHDGLL